MIKEFRAFIARGNVVDLAVAVVMGAAFGSVVKSLVDDLIMPPIGLVLGRADFSNLFIVLKDGLKVGPPYASLAEAKAAGAVTMNYGAFVTNFVSFVIVAFAVFVLVKLANRLYTRPVVTADTRACPFCVATIPRAATRCPQCTSQLASA
ncbi:MAG TPA: large conductance mechanosensitive channel protein MscL [Gemmatimonadaceae bacterium]|nr:large conductance mechanosensitive channel protein MscL [Gemmatimonadaceae bacterium]